MNKNQTIHPRGSPHETHSPIRIARRRITRVLADIPEDTLPTEVNGNGVCTLQAAAFFSLRRFALVVVCVCAMGFALGSVVHATRAFEPVVTFDANKVVIKPGLFIRCKLCNSPLYNIADPASACRIASSGLQFCPACHGTGAFEAMVKCPECQKEYDPRIAATSRTVEIGGFPELQMNCSVQAVCPYCAHPYIPNKTVTFLADY